MLAAKDGAIEELVAVNPFILSGSMVIGREREQVQINLPHPQVSRTHADRTPYRRNRDVDGSEQREWDVRQRRGHPEPRQSEAR